MDIKISVIIPVYNLEKYLSKCLDSLLVQTFKDFQIICVNDGSNDNSLNILQNYREKDDRFIIISQENSGAGSARNRGLEHAIGKYVQFLDGDDYFERDMLEKLYKIAEEHGADIAACSSRKVDDAGNIIESHNPNSPLNLNKLVFNKPFSYIDYKDSIFSLIGSAPWNKLYLRSMIKENNLKFPKLIGPDDLCFVQKANVCASKIVVINDELINYRYNRPGSVQTYRADHAINIVKVGLYIKQFLEEKGIYEFLEEAYVKMMLESIRGETSLCTEEQYQKFLKELKELLPNNWKTFNSALRCDYLTLDYLNKFIKNKQVFLWGASIFIENILKKEANINSNILGFIDKNKALWNKKFCGYKVFSPEILKTNKQASVLVTVYRNHEVAYFAIKNEIHNIAPEIEVLPDIFNGEIK